MNRSPIIEEVRLLPLDLRMRQTFVTTLGRKDVSHNLLVTVRLSDGSTGYGEASESLAMPDQTQAAMLGALRRLTPRFVGQSAGNLRTLSAIAWQYESNYPTAIAALECALLDAVCRSRRVPMWLHFGGRQRSVSTSLTISAWPPVQAARAARSAARSGIRRLKIKVTGAIDDDLSRVRAVHRAAPRALLVVDANQAFSASAAIAFADALIHHRLPVRYLEQPVERHDWEGLAEVRRRSPLPIIVDESADDVQAVQHMIKHHLTDSINIKLAKSGLLHALEIMRLSQRAGLRLMIGCMAESRVGLATSVHLACGSGAFDWVDLDSHWLVEPTPCHGGFTTADGRLRVHQTAPGTGITLPTTVVAP